MIYGTGALFTFFGLLIVFRRYAKMDWRKGDDIAGAFLAAGIGALAWPGLAIAAVAYGCGLLIYKGLLKIPVKQ